MTRDEFIDKLTEAGMTFDGHVTNGSIQAQMAFLESVIPSMPYGLNVDDWHNKLDELESGIVARAIPPNPVSALENSLRREQEQRDLFGPTFVKLWLEIRPFVEEYIRSRDETKT